MFILDRGGKKNEITFPALNEKYVKQAKRGDWYDMAN